MSKSYLGSTEAACQPPPPHHPTATTHLAGSCAECRWAAHTKRVKQDDRLILLSYLGATLSQTNLRALVRLLDVELLLLLEP